MYVIKYSGEKEEFNPEKVKRTLLRAGAPEKLAEEIVKEVESQIYEGITTKEIYNLVIKLLKKAKPVQIKYGLKGAIMQLGPAGYAFENYIAEILREYGYRTELRREIAGECVMHEIDIIARKEEKTYMIECKYHNSLGTFTKLKEVLYTYARFLDLKNHFDQVWLVSNTKVSQEGIKYGNCVGMKIISWRYPENGSLEKLIENKKLYPITILPAVDDKVLEKFFHANIMLVKDLLKYDFKQLQRKTRIKERKLLEIIREAKQLNISQEKGV